MKFCVKCRTAKPEDEFHRRSDSAGGRQPYCKECKREIDASTYARGGEEYKARKRTRNQVIAKRNALLVFEYLQDHPCVDCGESDPVVLEFDHVNGEKKGNISELVLRYGGWETILAEIAKCEVRCANCHSRITAKRLGNRRYMLWLGNLEEADGFSSV